MAERVANAGLQINEDLRFQKKNWTFERVGWVALLGLIVAAVLGVFGDGPLARASAGQRGGALFVEYPRLARHEGAAELRLSFGASASTATERRVAIDRDFLEGVVLERIQPEPLRTEIAGEQHVMVFPVANADRATGVTIFYRPNKLGVRRARIALEGGPSVSISQFVFP